MISMMPMVAIAIAAVEDRKCEPEPEYFIACDPARGADATAVCEFRDGRFVRFVPEEEWLVSRSPVSTAIAGRPWMDVQ